MDENLSESLGTDLQEGAVTSPVKKEKRIQTTEEREILVKGLEAIKNSGASPELLKVAELAIDWNSDKETTGIAKTVCIESFGDIEKLKDFTTSRIASEIDEFNAISKIVPVINNIKSFYARRPGVGPRQPKTKKIPLVQLVIDNTTYSVNKSYFESLKDMPREEKRAAILAHADTKAYEENFERL
jgi:hypothetical protein